MRKFGDREVYDFKESELKECFYHPFIGKPCLYKDDISGRLCPAIPYHASEDKDIVSTAVYSENMAVEGRNIHVKFLSVHSGDLIPIDANCGLAAQIYLQIFEWLRHNRDGTFETEERRRKREA